MFSKTYTVDFSHIDNRGIARPSALFDFMQDAATLHAEELHIGREALRAIWVLSRMKMQLRRPLRPYEELTIKTWCAGIRGACWHRSFSFAVNDEPLGGGHSMWVVLGEESRRILRPSKFPQAQEYLSQDCGELYPLDKLSCEVLAPHHTHRVCYSDLDLNNHVNNVKIVDLLSDGLDLNLTRDYISDLQVNYTAESHFGDEIELLSGVQGNTHCIFGRVAGQNRFESAATLSPIE